MAKVKICGIKTPEDWHVAADAGAALIGLVFYPQSPRHITLDAAISIRNASQEMEQTKRVALTVDADDAMLSDIIRAARPDIVQCHGSESPERLQEIKSKFDVAIIKAFRVSSPKIFTDTIAYKGVADYFLFDSAPQNTHEIGGTGQVFDWKLMQRYQGGTPWMLAGGLTPRNVASAIIESGAKMVDVSSGVEKDRGIKDHNAIRDFISQAQ